MTMPAFGADWILFGTTGNGKQYYDKESIERINNILKVWTMSDYITPRKDKKGMNIVSDFYLSEISCSESTMKPVSITKIYDDKSSSSDYVNSNPVKIQPDTNGELLLKAVCK